MNPVRRRALTGDEHCEEDEMASPLQAPIYSTLSNDPEMIDLVEEFVENLQDRVAAFELTLAQQDLEELTRLAHQLKGASSGYGFEPLGVAAAELEQAAKAAGTVEEVRASVDALIALCNRAVAQPVP